MSTISIILPTCGRHTFSRALGSVTRQLAADDEVRVVGDGAQPLIRDIVAETGDRRVTYCEHGPTQFYGNAQRNLGMQQANGDLIAFLDDDDEYFDGALDAIRRAATEHPARPLMFRLRCERPRFVIWRRPKLAVGNVSGGAFVVPNLPGRLARWPTPNELDGTCSDVTFIKRTLELFPTDSLVWRPEVIYRVPRRSYNAS